MYVARRPALKCAKIRPISYPMDDVPMVTPMLLLLFSCVLCAARCVELLSLAVSAVAMVTPMLLSCLSF